MDGSDRRPRIDCRATADRGGAQHDGGRQGSRPRWQARGGSGVHRRYIEATASPKGDLDLPGRWVDWENRVPGPSWISLAWRAQDDRLHTGARTTLNRLLHAEYTEPYEGGEVDWPSWRTFVAALGNPQLTMAGLRPDLWAIGHSTSETAAVIQQDGMILADSPDSPSLSALRDWLTTWENAGSPVPESYTPTLVPAGDGEGPAGWHLRLSH